MIADEEKCGVFGYNWKGLWSVVFAVPLVTAYIAWRYGQLGLIEGVVILIAFLFLAIRGMLPMCKVLLTKSEVDVSFILPNQQGGKFRHDEIESYAEGAITRRGKRILFCGFLQPKKRKRVILLRAGTKGFEELNSILSEMFPKPKEPSPQTSKGDLKKDGDEKTSLTN